MQVDTAVIPIAGLGTRFLPLSKVVPKEFFPLLEKPVLQYIVEETLQAGIKKIIFVVSPDKKEILKKYFNYDEDILDLLKKRKKEKAIEDLNSIPQINYNYVIQREPRGDGDAILRTEKLVGKKPFLVLFGDDVSLNGNGPLMAEQLVRTFKKIQKPLICLYKKPKKELSSYGVPKISGINGRLAKITDIVEKPEKNPPSNFALVGKYVLTPEVFYYLRKEAPHNGEIGLAFALQDMIKDGKEIFGLETDGEWLECGSKEKWIQSFLYLAQMKKKI
ncbi:MAG TPA: sugar phosphate nucleotidyltransferase [Candidatus Pacearchaeota archaeon]|nr:sugar phosphate nucleotidyltransferase [Candidatus Pacearchaeota archaeon]HOK94417.1 sugar phosphate nucleotidyltransferase [Candidatus Pacearchaeota archaeon]